MVKLSERDKDIIGTLCACVRMLSLDQIAAEWWPNSKTATEQARRRLSLLINARLLCMGDVLAAKLPAMDHPVLAWAPGDPEPELGAAAWILQSRWVEEAKTTKVYLATREASKLFGGKANGKIKHQFQASHDLGVSAMYLRTRRDRPEITNYWIGEDVLAPHRYGQKLPDAVIASSPRETPELVLEFGGAYDKARLIEFHTDCQQRATPYEIW